MSEQQNSESANTTRSGIKIDDRACLRQRILQTILPPILDVVDTILMKDIESTKEPFHSFDISSSQMPLLLKQKIKDLIYDDLLRINKEMAVTYFSAKSADYTVVTLGTIGKPAVKSNTLQNFLFKPKPTSSGGKHYTNPK